MPVPSDSMLMDEQVWQDDAYLVKLLLTCGLSGSQLVPKLDSFVILISWIEVCTSESASLMLQVLIGKNQSFTWILLIQFQGKLIAQLLAKGHLQHASWVLGTVAPWPSLRLYMLNACANWYMSTILLQGICLTLELLSNQRFRISKID